MVEKGALYRGMFYDFSELRLIDQIQTILEKFAEFERSVALLQCVQHSHGLTVRL